MNAGKPENMTQDSWEIHKKLNIEWLKRIVTEDFWTDEDLTIANNLIELIWLEQFILTVVS